MPHLSYLLTAFRFQVIKKLTNPVAARKRHFKPIQNSKSHSAKPQEWLKCWAFGQSKNHLPTDFILSIDGRLFG